jgi:phage tail-like protein
MLIIVSSTIVIAPSGKKEFPLPSSNFVVEIDGIASASFTYVEGVSSTTEVVEYREGTEQNKVRLFPGLTRYGPITLKRGLSDNSELWDWYESNINDPVDTRSMSIVFMDRGHSEQVRYNFHECWPSEYYIEALESNPSNVAYEVIVIQCESMDLA